MRHPVLVTPILATLIALAVPAQADWEAGLAAYNRGDFSTAATEIAKVVTGDPSDPRYAIAYYLLGSSYLQLHRPADGLANLRRAVDLDPDTPDYRLALGRTLLDQSEAAEASSVLHGLDTAALSQEQRLTAALLRASAALDLDRPADAVAVLESELPAADDSADLHRALGLAYYRSESPERAFAELARAYELDPDNAATGRNAVAIALDLAREQTDAEAKEMWSRKAYEVAATLAEAEPVPPHLELAARAAERAALDDEAVAWLTKAHEAAPDDPRVAYDLGRSLAAAGRDRRALEAFETALDAEPDAELEVRIHRQIAKTHARNLELADAAHHFRLAGDERAAQQIGELERQYREAIDNRSALLAKIAELRTMEAELEALSDTQGVAAVRERADAMQSEVDALEANLETVRTALKNL